MDLDVSNDTELPGINPKTSLQRIRLEKRIENYSQPPIKGHKLSPQKEIDEKIEEVTLPSSFYEVNITLIQNQRKTSQENKMTDQ